MEQPLLASSSVHHAPSSASSQQCTPVGIDLQPHGGLCRNPPWEANLSSSSAMASNHDRSKLHLWCLASYPTLSTPCVEGKPKWIEGGMRLTDCFLRLPSPEPLPFPSLSFSFVSIVPLLLSNSLSLYSSLPQPLISPSFSRFLNGRNSFFFLLRYTGGWTSGLCPAIPQSLG